MSRAAHRDLTHLPVSMQKMRSTIVLLVLARTAAAEPAVDCSGNVYLEPSVWAGVATHRDGGDVPFSWRHALGGVRHCPGGIDVRAGAVADVATDSVGWAIGGEVEVDRAREDGGQLGVRIAVGYGHSTEGFVGARLRAGPVVLGVDAFVSASYADRPTRVGLLGGIGLSGKPGAIFTAVEAAGTILIGGFLLYQMGHTY